MPYAYRMLVAPPTRVRGTGRAKGDDNRHRSTPTPPKQPMVERDFSGHPGVQEVAKNADELSELGGDVVSCKVIDSLSYTLVSCY